MDFKSDYEAKKSIIELCDNVYNGSLTASTYLQQFTRENAKKFEDRVIVLTLDNYVKRTVDSIANIIFRKPFDKSELDFDIFKTIDLTRDINQFGKDILKSVVKDGYTFILVDAPAASEDVKTKADELRAGLRPYFVHIERNNVVNWKMKTADSYKWVVIREFYSTYDGFKEIVAEQYKVFYDSGLVEVYRDDELFSKIETGLKEVPIVKVGVDDIPIVYDQAKLNISHMNRNSELDNYIRVASAPIPVSYMLPMDENSVVTIGVNDGVNFDAPKNEAGFEWVGLKAENTQAIKERIADLETQMLNIAVTFATSSKVKTATQVETESTEDESKLVSIAQEVERGINKAIKLLGIYDKTYKTDKEVFINKDYDSNKLTPEQVNQNVTLYREGIISLDKLWELLEAGEVLSIEDKDREKALLLEV